MSLDGTTAPIGRNLIINRRRRESELRSQGQPSQRSYRRSGRTVAAVVPSQRSYRRSGRTVGDKAEREFTGYNHTPKMVCFWESIACPSFILIHHLIQRLGIPPENLRVKDGDRRKRGHLVESTAVRRQPPLSESKCQHHRPGENRECGPIHCLDI